MPSQDELYIQMEQILDTLIQTTKQLNEGAKHSIPEKELELLQQKQNEILKKAALLDRDIKQKTSGTLSQEISQKRQKIYQRLTEFQSINQEFIAHVGDHKRIIQKKELSSEIRKMITENDVEGIVK